MKRFSLSYNLELSDIKYYEKTKNKEAYGSIKRIAAVYVAVVAYTVFFSVPFALFLALFSFLALLLPFLIVFIYDKIRKNSDVFKKEVIVDFYDDHISIIRPQSKGSKAFSEKHVGFTAFSDVEERDRYFIFFFRDFSFLIIPKRAIGEDEYQQIKNLIDNYFNDVYTYEKN